MSRSYAEPLPEQSLALGVAPFERRCVNVQFVSGFRARVAAHLVRRWSPPRDAVVVVAPATDGCRSLVRCR